jgi:hypothetical protein
MRREIGSVREYDEDLKEVAVAHTRIIALDHSEKAFKPIREDIKTTICLK